MNYFAEPGMIFWAVAAVGVWVAGLLAARARKRALGGLGDAGVVQRMLPAGLIRRRRWIRALEVLGLVMITLALSGPLLGSRMVESRQRGLDVVIAVDCSLSMLAQDFQPNRLAHAKLALGQLIERLAGSRIGVLAFAGQSYLMCPLTIDLNAARDTLDSLEPGAVPTPGTLIGDAIRLAAQGLDAGEGASRILVLLTDGEDHKSEPMKAAKDAARRGLKIFAVGIGSPTGEPIPVLDETGRSRGFKRDKKGEVVLSRLDEKTLMEIARETGGQYYRATASGDEVEPLAQALESLQSGDRRAQLFNRYENRFQWPLGAGIVLLLIAMTIPEGKRREN